MTKYFLLCAALSAACGKASTDDPGVTSLPAASAPSASPGAPVADPPPASGPQDRCEVHVTGDVRYDFVATGPRSASAVPNGRASAATDYWMSDEDVRDGIKMMVGVLSKKSDAEIAQEVDAQMKKDPRLVLLLLNCGDADNFLNFGPGVQSRYADVPFKPGRYRIANGERSPGDFSAMIGLKPNGERGFYELAEPGVFEITRFDRSAIVGTFHLKVKRPDSAQTLVVDGAFDYGCKGRSCT